MFAKQFETPLSGRPGILWGEPTGRDALGPCHAPASDPRRMAASGVQADEVRGYRNPDRHVGLGATVCAPPAVRGDGAFAEDVARCRKVMRAARRGTTAAQYRARQRVKPRGNGPVDGDLD